MKSQPISRYGISAEELHDGVIETIKEWFNHKGIKIPWWLYNHDQRPLSQTITMALTQLDANRYANERD